MNITFFLNNIKDLLYDWQTLIGATIGASAPFLLWWFIESRREHKKKEQYLYYLQRLIVDQINSLNEVRDTTQSFLDLKLKGLLKHIDENPGSAYSVDIIFFPLFSVRPLPNDLNATSSGSGYIDNKVGQIYALSRDFPHIINDVRIQLKDTLERNEKIAFGKLNSAEVQKEQFKQNILEYEKMMRDDLLGKSIPVYFKILANTLVAVRKKTEISFISWKRKFDPRWKFYTKKSSYLQERKQIVTKMDTYFEPATKQQLEEINQLYKEKDK